MCQALLTFCVRFDLDHGNDWPGLIRPAPHVELPTTET